MRAAPSRPVLSRYVPSRTLCVRSSLVPSPPVLSYCFLSRPITSCTVLSSHGTLSPSENSRLVVTNTHKQQHNLTVTTTSKPVLFVSCQVRSRRFLSCHVLSRPSVSCPIRSCPVPSWSRSSSRWDFHFHSYVLTIYVRLY